MIFTDIVKLSKMYDEKIKYLSDRFEDLEHMKYKVTPILSNMPKSKSAETSKMESVVCEQDNLREQIIELTNKSAKVKRRMFMALSEIDAYSRHIIELRYLEGLKWQEVSYKTNKSKQWLQKVCRNAIPILDKSLNND